MKKASLFPFLIIALLFACAPKKPELTLTEVPAEPLVRSLEQRRQSFLSLKASAAVEVRKKGRKRGFDMVAVLLQGQERIRIEAYGPLGQTFFTLLWEGEEMLLEMNGQTRIVPPKNSGLERILGAEVDPAELAAILAGNIPWNPRDARSRAFCDPGGRCSLELRQDERMLKVYPAPGEADFFSSFELFQSGKLVYRARFELFEEKSGYSLPRKITVENPEKRVALQVEYTDIDPNVSLGADAFLIPDPR